VVKKLTDKHKAYAGIVLKRNLYLNTLLFADDQVIIQDSEDKLQKSVYILNQMRKNTTSKYLRTKPKLWLLKGKHLVRSKIEVDGSILEQVRQFNYLGCELSLDGEPDFDKKRNRFQGICSTIRKHLQKTFTDTQMKFYKVVARPSPTVWQRNMSNHEERHDSPRSCRNALSKKCYWIHKAG
jgi:hypothetical protein